VVCACVVDEGVIQRDVVALDVVSEVRIPEPLAVSVQLQRADEFVAQRVMDW